MIRLLAEPPREQGEMRHGAFQSDPVSDIEAIPSPRRLGGRPHVLDLLAKCARFQSLYIRTRRQYGASTRRHRRRTGGHRDRGQPHRGLAVEARRPVADNASAARLVLGGRITPVSGLDLRLVGMLCYRNGVPIDSGAGAAALGHPARCVDWLANKLSAQGSGLRRGDIVLSGALHRMVPVRPGDVFRAEFAHLGAVSAHFSGRDAA